MPCIKIVPERYDTPEAVEGLIDYVYRKSLIRGGMSINPRYAAEQMELCRLYWGKTTGRLAYHFVISYGESEGKHISDAASLAILGYEVCDFFADEYQIVFGVHRDDYWHVHFVMNPVSYRTGKKYLARRHDDVLLRDYVTLAVSSLRPVPVFYN